MATAPPIPEELWNQLPPAAQAEVLTVIATLQARIDELETRVRELEARLNQNSSNSSKPPSSDPPHVKPAPPQSPTGKRKGGQSGHTRHIPPTLPPTKSSSCDPTPTRTARRPSAATIPAAYPPGHRDSPDSATRRRVPASPAHLRPVLASHLRASAGRRQGRLRGSPPGDLRP
jgi:hypothetical protein